MCQSARLSLPPDTATRMRSSGVNILNDLNGAGDLFVDKRDETGLAKGGIVARETDHRARTGRAFSAVHGVPGFGRRLSGFRKRESRCTMF